MYYLTIFLKDIPKGVTSRQIINGLDDSLMDNFVEYLNTRFYFTDFIISAGEYCFIFATQSPAPKMTSSRVRSLLASFVAHFPFDFFEYFTDMYICPSRDIKECYNCWQVEDLIDFDNACPLAVGCRTFAFVVPTADHAAARAASIRVANKPKPSAVGRPTEGVKGGEKPRLQFSQFVSNITDSPQSCQTTGRKALC